MRPFHHSSAPALDRGLERRLRRLDRDLFVTWSPWVLSARTGQPILTEPAKPIHAPAYYLWVWGTDGRAHLLNTMTRFTHRNVAALESDAARFLAPTEIIRRRAQAATERRARARRWYLDRAKDVFKENTRRAQEFLEGRTDALRDPKVFSYSRQSNHGTPAPVPTTAKEAGFYVP